MNFAQLDEVAPDQKFDFVLADLGVSSMQIDNPERGFTFKHDLTTLEQLHEMEERYPRLAGLMLGRGILARPSLAKEYTEGREWSHEEHIHCLRTLHEKLAEQYSNIVKSDAQLHSKLRTFWEYTEPLIGRKPYKRIMKSGNLRNYMSAIGELR